MRKLNTSPSSFRNGRFALTAVATAMLGLSAQTAFSQEGAEPNAELEEIVVTGIRSSLERASDIKRNGQGVVDAISAEDIGKFPDSNLAESLQRITGVSIDRSNNEGNQITVRGFGPRFNLVTLNGRSMPTSNALFQRFLDRSFNFNELAAGGVSAVEVYKTGRADLPTGGIGSTVNVRTPKPFDFDGFKATFNAKATHDTTNKRGSDYTPDVSFIVSDHFADKKVGLLAAVSYSERDSRLESGNIAGTARILDGNPGNIDSSRNTNDRNALYISRSFNLETQDVERERINGQFVLQLAPTDNVEIALDYNLSRYDEFSRRNSTGFWFGFDGQRQGVSDEQGVVSTFDDGNNIDLDAFGFVNNLVTDNDSFGINLDWAVNDNLSFNLDAHNSVSESQPGGEIAELVINFRTPNVDFVQLDFGDGDIPAVNFGADFDVFDTSQLISDIGQQRGRQIENEIEEIKLVGTYDFGADSGLQRITFGGSAQEYTYSFDEVTTFFLLNGFNNGGVGFGSEPIGSTFSDFTGGGPGLFTRLFTYDPLVAVQGAQVDGFFQPPEFRIESVNEETTSLFVQADFETAIGDMPLTVNLGARYEETDVIGRSAVQPILNTQLINQAEVRLVRGEGLVDDELQGNYDFLLPSVNLKLDVSDNFVARASYSETITRQPIGGLTPRFQFNVVRPGTTGSVSRGNANLEPALAESLDLSFEWYYKEGSYASIGLFSKDVSAFLVSDQIRSTLTGADGTPLRDPSFNQASRPECPGNECFGIAGDPEIPFDINTTFNSEEEGNVKGAEIALQHVFENGFGLIANYTYTDGDIEFDRDNFFAQEPAPLTGLSDSANLVAFYENDRFQARVAANWRDEFLAFVGGGEPTFTEAFTQVDFSASYNINDQYSVFIEGLNVTDEISRNHGRSSRFLSRVTSSGPRYAVGIRGSF